MDYGCSQILVTSPTRGLFRTTRRRDRLQKGRAGKSAVDTRWIVLGRQGTFKRPSIKRAFLASLSLFSTTTTSRPFFIHVALPRSFSSWLLSRVLPVHVTRPQRPTTHTPASLSSSSSCQPCGEHCDRAPSTQVSTYTFLLAYAVCRPCSFLCPCADPASLSLSAKLAQSVNDLQGRRGSGWRCMLSGLLNDSTDIEVRLLSHLRCMGRRARRPSRSAPLNDRQRVEDR